MKLILFALVLFISSVQADVKTSSGKAISPENLGIVNIELV